MKDLVEVRHLFGDNRAEWSLGDFEGLFVEPPYLRRLKTRKPCFVMGGRGTGKTTSLMSLGYQSTLASIGAQGGDVSDMTYFGFLVRMNKNRVRAFRGGGASQEHWEKCFAHYVNILICIELCKLNTWLVAQGRPAMAEQSIREVSADLGLSAVDDLQRLDVSMRAEISALQLHVNNPSKAYAGSFSVAESPVRVFVDCMRRDGVLPTGVVFCCIDEYENLLDYQQAILNTYIKHAEDPLTYKIGLRKFGLRNRRTIDEGDLLACPDDYDEIEIADNGFSEFAKAVAEARLRRANEEGVSVSRSLREFLSELTFAEEARLLGASEVASIVRKEIEGSSSLELSSFVGSLPDESAYFIKFWAESEGGSIEVLAADWMRNPQSWATRLGNYGYASLFWLSNGRKGARIRKYYSGERVLLAMAGGNIRYFLELIDLAISYEQPTASTGGLYSVSAKAQTLAAREVGKRRLSQLDGLAENGPQLKRAVLGLGKVFFELARNPLGRTPEATSFVLAGDAVSCERVRDLLFEGVAHLAFEVDARTKATSTSEVKDEEFRIHRIFSAFFEMSHRKKRRITVSASDVLALLDEKPSKAISAMLGSANINEDDSLPEQLEFFARFYKDGQVQG